MDLKYCECNKMASNIRSKFSNIPKGICSGSVIDGTSLKQNLTSRIQRVQESSKILENVLDISTTLVKILTSCGIHECKANKALDVIIYAFMHFDEVVEHPGGKRRKRLRKEEFLNDLMKDCDMTQYESKLTYSVVKCAFRAFYHKQVVSRFDATFVDEREWKNAANKTVNAFAASGATQSEVEVTGRRIVGAYQNYISRMQAKKSRSLSQGKTVAGGECMCGKKYVRTDPPSPPSAEAALFGQLCCEVCTPPDSHCPQVVCKDRCGRIFLRVVGNRIAFDPYTMECEAKRAMNAICCGDSKNYRTTSRDSNRPNICEGGSFDTQSKLCENGKDVDTNALKLLGDASDQVLADICRHVEDTCNQEPKAEVKETTEEMAREGELEPTGIIEDRMEFENESEQEPLIETKSELEKESEQEPLIETKSELENESEQEREIEKRTELEKESVKELQNELEKEPEIVNEEDEEDAAAMFDENQVEEEEQIDEKSKAERSAAGGLKANFITNGQSGNPDMLMAVKFSPRTDGGQIMEVDLQGYWSDPPSDILELRIFFNRISTLHFECKQVADSKL